MAEDRHCISEALFCDDQTRPAKRQKTSSTQRILLDLVARSEILGHVGNCFSNHAKSSVSSWPTIHSHGKMLCRQSRLNFDNLFGTHRSYMNPNEQIRALVLENESDLESLAKTIEQQIVPALVAKSPLLLQEEEQAAPISRILLPAAGAAAGPDEKIMCWHIASPMLHRVIVRTVLLSHFAAQLHQHEDCLSEHETHNLLANIQSMILRMQVCALPLRSSISGSV